MKKKFPADLLEALSPSFEVEGHKTLKIEFLEHRRWYLRHKIIFQEPGQTENAWRAYFRVPATESQEEDNPWDSDKEGNVECTLVKPVERAVIDWVEC